MGVGLVDASVGLDAAPTLSGGEGDDAAAVGCAAGDLVGSASSRLSGPAQATISTASAAPKTICVVSLAIVTSLLDLIRLPAHPKAVEL